MYRYCARNLVRNGLAGKQGILHGGQIRFQATAPPKPPRADLQSIPQALRELLPEPRKRDPSAPPKRGRSLLFYVALISPLFIWIEVEKYFDPKPLLEKKRIRILRGRLERLQEGSRSTSVQLADQKSLVAYMRLLLTTMLPEEYLRNLRCEEVLALLEEEIPETLLPWLREVCTVIYQLSLKAEDEVKTAENIQDAAEGILRKAFLDLHTRLPPRPAASE
ncbi:hypothetical protein B0H15DRAFT_67676 [Mycena belliarum]|uniref:Uncharacterized protein n=1 Tax=Mycena belliarum TaxID=1033014 RepID=A0AAD6UG81_9AGAR|nr:hypothetical protein B0H15DRAFT_67676 [Mycena belliae]